MTADVPLGFCNTVATHIHGTVNNMVHRSSPRPQYVCNMKIKAKKSQYRSQNCIGHTTKRARICQNESALRKLRTLPFDAPGVPSGTSDFQMNSLSQKEPEEEEEGEKLRHLIREVEKKLKEHEEITKVHLSNLGTALVRAQGRTLELEAMLELSWAEIADFQEAELDVIDVGPISALYVTYTSPATVVIGIGRLFLSYPDPTLLEIQISYMRRFVQVDTVNCLIPSDMHMPSPFILEQLHESCHVSGIWIGSEEPHTSGASLTGVFDDDDDECPDELKALGCPIQD
ncbi:hypothetical protein EV421DRAFT_1734787 [Armillaria borealis]|uniref:Uncharacterized protein n=1 Tax=Armillaria borealis TaxID=47425 RepID=A0AA39JLX7_9AGAR|nr:hypothetical protein EV421DRAFT_1734787 [Armillaria borealis]